MGATLSQPYISLLPRRTKSKSKRPRYLFRLRIRWKKKRTLPGIYAPFSNPGHDHQDSRESKLYDSNSTEGEEKSPIPDSHTFTSATSAGPAPTSPVAEKAPGVLDLHSPNELSSARVTSPSGELPATEDIQAINASIEDTKREDDSEIEHDASDSDSDFSPERPHTPPPWDMSLSGYGSVLEVSRPFRARRVFEHPLVKGHFVGNKGDSFMGGGGGGGGGPIAAQEKRRLWRVWESTKGEEEGKSNGVNQRKKMVGLKSGVAKAIETRERERGKRKEKSEMIKTKRRMSEWRKWKPLPRYPACTGVAQRATSSTWAATTGDSAWREVVEQAEGQEYQGGDEKEEEADQGDYDDNDDEDLEEAIKRFLEMKIPVDLSSLRRLRTSFAGTGEYITTANSGTRETGKEELEKAMEGEQGQLSPLAESLMFTDTDIEGFEFLFEERDEGGGIWGSGTAVGVKSGRVEGNGEACKMDGPTGGFAGGDASRAEVSEEDAGHTVRRAFSVTQRLSRWKERK